MAVRQKGVVVFIRPDGSLFAQAVGYAGRSCLQGMDLLRDLLAKAPQVKHGDTIDMQRKPPVRISTKR